ncbi:MAG: RNA polymerase sigma factor, partial [Planctomycetota bacterium]
GVEEEELVRRALAAVSERCRELISLLYFEPAALSYDEIAERLGVPRGSLGPTRRRCLDRMRTALPESLGGSVSKTGDRPS